MGKYGIQYFIRFNPYLTSYDKENGRGNISLERTVQTAIIHELEHIRLAIQYKKRLPGSQSHGYYCISHEKEKNRYIDYEEVLAIKNENIVRVQLGKLIRTHYNNHLVYEKTYNGKPINDGGYNFYLLKDVNNKLSEELFTAKYLKENLVHTKKDYMDSYKVTQLKLNIIKDKGILRDEYIESGKKVSVIIPRGDKESVFNTSGYSI